MHLRKETTIGITLAAIAVVALAAIAFVSRADAHSTSQGVKLCLQERRDSGYFGGDLTRDERRAIRLQFRLCIRDAVWHDHNGSSSSRSSMSSSSRSSSSVSSGTGSSMSSSRSSTGSSISSSSRSSVSSTSRSSSSRSSSSRSVVVDVEIEDFEYEPATLNIKKGTTVRWENEDDAPHTVTSTGGTLVLNSGVLDEDETYSYTFTNTGSYHYFCTIHPEMKGRVNVTE
jgi:plastocyanin